MAGPACICEVQFTRLRPGLPLGDGPICEPLAIVFVGSHWGCGAHQRVHHVRREEACRGRHRSLVEVREPAFSSLHVLLHC
jgi:hypothetical protein